MIQLTLTLKMTTAQVVETSVTVNNNSPIQDYVHPDDQTQPTFDNSVSYDQKKTDGTTYIHVNLINQTNVEALIFFRLLLSNCLNWKIYCDDHSLLSKVLLRRKMCTFWFHFTEKKLFHRGRTGEIFCDCIRSHDHAGHLTAKIAFLYNTYVPMNA